MLSLLQIPTIRLVAYPATRLTVRPATHLLCPVCRQNIGTSSEERRQEQELLGVIHPCPSCGLHVPDWRDRHYQQRAGAFTARQGRRSR